VTARLTLAAVGLLLVAACDSQSRPKARRQLVAGGEPKVGERTFARYGCVSCRTIPGVNGAHGKVGPSLDAWVQRRYVAGVAPNSPETLIRFIRDPQSVAPGTAMPNTGVTEHDARQMAAYLYTLR
jgi:cytochrome c